MYGYDGLIDFIWLESMQMRAEYWMLTEVLVWTTLVQITAAAVGVGIGYFIARFINGRLKRRITRLRMTQTTARLLLRVAVSLVFPLITLVTLSVVRAITYDLGWPVIVLTTVINLVFVWIVVRLASWVIRNETWSRIVAVAAFAIAALDVLGLLHPTLRYLDDVGLRVGTTHLSVLEIIKGGFALAAFIWIAILASRLLEQRLHRAPSLTPSLKLLTGKLLKVVLVAVAVVVALNSIGIDLTAFAVFTGALGVGIGFGLQRPIANLISGVILLLDRSIKPGDVIELNDPAGGSQKTFGWISALNARYALLTTRDGKEWQIPNEDLITQRVVNWSYSDNQLRLLTPFGISYDSDVRTAIRLSVEAAKANARVLKDPPPVCRLMGFGNSSIDLELRIWIADPTNGVINVRSEILLAMLDSFREHGIRIPFPQRDVHIKADSELAVTRNRPPNSAAA